MATVRLDPLTGRPVVISEHRIPAPPAFTPGHRPDVAVCPFCPGHEHLTEPTIAARGPGEAWVARAFPNRRPALRPEEPHHPIGDALERGHMAVGAHEVIAEGRDHEGPEPDGPSNRAALQLAADRMEDLRRDGRFAALGWFRNRGVEAGASQPHPHAQVVALPVVPALHRDILHRQQAKPGLLQLLAEAADEGGRQVVACGGVVAFVPWASASPFEVWITPDAPVERLWDDRDRVDGLADALTAVTAALHATFGYCPYNAVVHQAPAHDDARDSSWHVRVFPRLIPNGGFELWSGGALHPLVPDQAAAVLRGHVP